MSNHIDDFNSDNTYNVDPQLHSPSAMPKPIDLSNVQSLSNADNLVDPVFNITNNNHNFSNVFK